MTAAGSYVVFQHQSGRYPHLVAIERALDTLTVEGEPR